MLLSENEINQVEARLSELARLLKGENGPLLANYGFSVSEWMAVNRNHYFSALRKLADQARGVLSDYGQKQFSTSTSLESIRFLLRNRWKVAKWLIRLRIAGIRHFYFSNPQAALDGLAELARFSQFLAPFRSSESRL